ncbi:MAG: hypothetical protein NZM18_12610 [Thermoflexales bacterium]|nr:hypothetical protein [Thermoflexales bacterium]MDW8350299.1 3-oxoacyl-[acyl-carrier-protein] synthase III C-terminal domain-containing protein [Anaerolineae bacterium]
MAYLLSVGTALPPYVVTQEEAAAFSLRHFEGRLARHGQLMSIFTNARIAKRHFVAPLEWFSTPHHSLKERNDLYICSAEALGIAAARQAFDCSGVAPHEVDFIVFVSTTGLATPSMDARLIAKLGMRPDAKRLPVWGLGCAGGVAGLARAAEFVRAYPDKLALLVSVETCSITFQFHDFSKKNFVATAIFADGAAAALIGGADWMRRAGRTGKVALQYVASHSYIFPNSEHVMGWDIVDTGFSVVFAPEIPARIARDMRPVVEDFLNECRLNLSHLSHYVLHPGGARVIDAYHEAFELSEAALQSSSDVLYECGNMSSPTVLFVLQRVLHADRVAPGEHALMGALGPGFSSELALLRGAVV